LDRVEKEAIVSLFEVISWYLPENLREAALLAEI
jgi:hypothetical protein